MTSLRIKYPQVPEWKVFNKSESSIFQKLSEILKRFVFLNKSTLKGLRRYYLIDSPVPIVAQNGLAPFRHASHLFLQRSPLVILAISSWFFARAISGWTHVFPQASSLKQSRHFRLDSHRETVMASPKLWCHFLFSRRCRDGFDVSGRYFLVRSNRLQTSL